MMFITDDRKKEIILEADFAGVEQVKTTLSIFMKQGYTMQLGIEEWNRLKELVEQRFLHEER